MQNSVIRVHQTEQSKNCCNQVFVFHSTYANPMCPQSDLNTPLAYSTEKKLKGHIMLGDKRGAT
jgi:hypothetical protein